jgi:hypothetical protein
MLKRMPGYHLLARMFERPQLDAAAHAPGLLFNRKLGRLDHHLFLQRNGYPTTTHGLRLGLRLGFGGSRRVGIQQQGRSQG